MSLQFGQGLGEGQLLCPTQWLGLGICLWDDLFSLTNKLVLAASWQLSWAVDWAPWFSSVGLSHNMVATFQEQETQEKKVEAFWRLSFGSHKHYFLYPLGQDGHKASPGFKRRRHSLSLFVGGGRALEEHVVWKIMLWLSLGKKSATE